MDDIDDLARDIAMLKGHAARMSAVAAAGGGAELTAAVLDFAHARLCDSSRTAEDFANWPEKAATTTGGGGYDAEDDAAAVIAASSARPAAAGFGM